MKKLIRVGSRESSLALTQTKLVIDAIKKAYPNVTFEIVSMKTKGDILLDTRLDKIGGKGLFIKELETALLDGTVDFAVHSMKDMPSDIPEGLVIAAASAREDPRDVLLTAGGKGLEELKANSVVGTSSARRQVQLLEKRPDLRIKTLRGNVNTRLNKLLNEEYDAIVLAAAGLIRLGLSDGRARYFNIEDMLPAVGQGVLCIEARKDDSIIEMLSCINNMESLLCVEAERSFMKRLDGGCSVPIAAHAVIKGSRMRIYGMYVPENTGVISRGTVDGESKEAASLGVRLADIISEKIRQGVVE